MKTFAFFSPPPMPFIKYVYGHLISAYIKAIKNFSVTAVTIFLVTLFYLVTTNNDGVLQNDPASRC